MFFVKSSIDFYLQILVMFDFIFVNKILKIVHIIFKVTYEITRLKIIKYYDQCFESIILFIMKLNELRYNTIVTIILYVKILIIFYFILLFC